jgi:hypothetical protein
MPKPVSLSELLATLQLSDPTTVLYVDRTTGQIVESAQIRDEANGPKKCDSVPGPDRFERIPILTEQEEIELARQFSAATQKAEDRQRLNLALSTANPHEAFQTALFRCQIANEWFPFRDKHLLQRAKSWLDVLSVPYIDDATRHAD